MNTEDPIIELSDNKIIFSQKAIELLNIAIGERISINYCQVNNELTFPIISKSEIFVNKDAGNKLTKSNTISFRGIQKKVLSEYGTVFKLKEFSFSTYKNIFQLISINNISSNVCVENKY